MTICKTTHTYHPVDDLDPKGMYQCVNCRMKCKWEHLPRYTGPYIISTSKEPEHQLIELCRAIMTDPGSVVSINFRVEREFGEYQTYSIGRKDETGEL